MEPLSSQSIVDKASERMTAIIKMKVIEPVKPGESKVQVWHSAMKELREQLVRAIGLSTVSDELTCNLT